MRKNPLANTTTRGGIITSEFLERFRSEIVKHEGTSPSSYQTYNRAAPKDAQELSQTITKVWEELKERWDALSYRYLNMDSTNARTRWVPRASR